MSNENQLLQKLGGEAGCHRLAKEFYSRVATDLELKPLFPGKSMRCATEEFGAFLIQFLDGDENQTQYRWWLSLRESHARFKITQKQRAAWLKQMRATLNAFNLEGETRDALAQFFLVTSAYILGAESGEPQHEELSHRWKQQLALDQLISDITLERDSFAIAAAKAFASRRSVLVGILARMMEAGREELVEFVLQSIETDPELLRVKNNDRALLHCAASCGCVPVVQRLLAMGMDPNVLGGGNHTPLYRVANDCVVPSGADVVRELVKAGADVDHNGGVTRSTALHAAARYGHLETAVALLDLGASVSARDNKGLTPLDRAKNCRKFAVAAEIEARM